MVILITHLRTHALATLSFWFIFLTFYNLQLWFTWVYSDQEGFRMFFWGGAGKSFWQHQWEWEEKQKVWNEVSLFVRSLSVRGWKRSVHFSGITLCHKWKCDSHTTTPTIYSLRRIRPLNFSLKKRLEAPKTGGQWCQGCQSWQITVQFSGHIIT